MFDLETRAREDANPTAAIFTVTLTHVTPPPDQLRRDKWGQLRFACFSTTANAQEKARQNNESSLITEGILT